MKDSPTRFDKLVSVKKIKIDKKDALAALFVTANNQLPGSAVCIFALDDLDGIFPESCSGKSRRLEPEVLKTYNNEGKKTKQPSGIIVQPIENAFSGAIYTRTLFSSATERDTLTTLEVERLDYSREGSEVYLFFMGSSGGKVVRSVLIVDSLKKSLSFNLIAETDHFKAECQSDVPGMSLVDVPKSQERRVKTLVVDSQQGRLYAVFAGCVTFSELATCSQHKCDEACMRTNEQVCRWRDGKCVADFAGLTRIDTTDIYPTCDVAPGGAEERGKRPKSERENGAKNRTHVESPVARSMADRIELDEDDTEDDEELVLVASVSAVNGTDLETSSFFDSFGFREIGILVAILAFGILVGVLIAYFGCVKRKIEKKSSSSSQKPSRHDSERAVRKQKPGLNFELLNFIFFKFSKFFKIFI